VTADRLEAALTESTEFAVVRSVDSNRGGNEVFNFIKLCDGEGRVMVLI